jgi:tetratricopeptide (TPR) repeat protein
MALRGDIKLGIRLLEDEIDERLEKYGTRDKGVWAYSKGIAQICNNHVGSLIDKSKFDSSQEYLKIARKYTEPIPNSNWGMKPEWKSIRKNIFKNQAFLYQKQGEFQKAFDAYRVSYKMEEQLGDFLGTTQLNCAVLLSKLNNMTESLSFARDAKISHEDILGISSKVKLQMIKAPTPAHDSAIVVEEFNTRIRNYAIALHMCAKGLSD